MSANNLTDLEAMAIIVREFRKVSKANRVTLFNILHKEDELIGDAVDNPYIPIMKDYIAGGRRDKIPAIKAVRDASRPGIGQNPTLGLKEAKDLVESW